MISLSIGGVWFSRLFNDCFLLRIRTERWGGKLVKALGNYGLVWLQANPMTWLGPTIIYFACDLPGQARLALGRTKVSLGQPGQSLRWGTALRIFTAAWFYAGWLTLWREGGLGQWHTQHCHIHEMWAWALFPLFHRASNRIHIYLWYAARDFLFLFLSKSKIFRNSKTIRTTNEIH